MIIKDQLEQPAMKWFQCTGWNYVHGAVIAPEGVAAEREDRGNIEHRTPNIKRRNEDKRSLAEAVWRLNPKLPESAAKKVVHVVTKPEHPSLVQSGLPLDLQGKRSLQRLAHVVAPPVSKES